jgi:hypothetical protein
MSTDVDKCARQIHVNDYGSDKSIFRSSAHTDRIGPERRSVFIISSGLCVRTERFASGRHPWSLETRRAGFTSLIERRK